MYKNCTVSGTGIYASLVCDSGDISLSRKRKNARPSSFHRCFHINEKIIEEFFILWKKEEKHVSQIMFSSLVER